MEEDDIPPLSTKEKIALIVDFFKTKNGKITGGSVLGLLLVVLLLVKACEPAKGGMLYGVCSTFAEQNLKFPHTMEKGYIEQYSSGVRIYYSYTDGFGQHMSEFIECTFEMHPQEGLQLKAVIYDTVKEVTEKMPLKNKGRIYPVQQKYIDAFNNSQSITAIQSMEPDLTLPRSGQAY